MISFTTDRLLHSDDGETLEIDGMSIARAKVTDRQGAFTRFPHTELTPADYYGENTLYRNNLSFFGGEEGSANVLLSFTMHPKLNSVEHRDEIKKKDWTFTVNFNCYGVE